MSAISCVTSIFLVNGLRRDKGMLHHTSSMCKFELRFPYLSWVIGAVSSSLLCCAETLIRFNGFDVVIIPASNSTATQTTGVVAAASSPEWAWDSYVLLLGLATWFVVGTGFISSQAAKMGRGISAFSGKTCAEVQLVRHNGNSSAYSASPRSPAYFTDSASPAYFAAPGPDEIRQLLDEYWNKFGTGPLADPNPYQFRDYVLQAVRQQGHSTLSYVADHMIPLAFQERVDAMWEERYENPRHKETG